MLITSIVSNYLRDHNSFLDTFINKIRFIEHGCAILHELVSTLLLFCLLFFFFFLQSRQTIYVNLGGIRPLVVLRINTELQNIPRQISLTHLST